MRVKKNPDKEFVNEIKKQLRANNGYCPCQIVKNADTKCMCKEFRDMVENGIAGMCGCGMYISVDD